MDRKLPEYSYHEQRFACFATLWACSILFQLVSLDSMARGLQVGTAAGLVEFALALSAGAVIWQPTLASFSILAVVQLTDAYLLLPTISNHRTLVALVHCTFFAALAAAYRSGRKRSRTASVFDAFSKAARIETIAVYFFAAFAKFNSGFLDPATSCGSKFYTRMASNSPLFPATPWAAEAAIHATLLCEAGIPMLLLFARTRQYGILTGLVFHYMLSIDYIQHTMDFSSLMFALLFLFTPISFVDTGKSALCKSGSCERDLRWARLLLLAAWTIVLTSGVNTEQFGTGLGYTSRHVLWYSYGLCIIALFVGLSMRSPRQKASEIRGYFRVQSALTGLAVFSVVLNGLGPYVGFKTRSSFDMYSNLRLEGDNPNHLIVPGSLDLFGYLSDRVQVLESNDRRLQSAKSQEMELLYFEFASYVRSRPDVRGRFLRNGSEFEITNEAERLAIEPPSWLTRKFLRFRDVDRQPVARCDW